MAWLEVVGHEGFDCEADRLNRGIAKHLLRGRIPQHDTAVRGVSHDDGVADMLEEATDAEVARGKRARPGCIEHEAAHASGWRQSTSPPG
jgi:hypothetical protein